jgi:GNAT superfamily N-acetyltransferase
MLGTLESARWIEAEAWTDVAVGAPASLRDELGVDVVRWGETTLLRSTRARSVLFNRVFGLAGGGLQTESVLQRALECFERTRTERFFVHARADDAGASMLMLHHGLVRFRRPWVKLARGREGPVLSSDHALDIGLCRPNEAEAWAEVLTEGLETGDGGIPLLAATVGRPGWTALVARDGDEVVGAAAMFVRDGIASLTGASTRASHRRRGVQRALMARRILMALDLGCTLITSETGIEVPGQPNSSCNNMMRCGLRIVGTIDHYTRPDDRA